MKRLFCACLLAIVIILSACVSDTVASGGVVVRGQPSPVPSADYSAIAAHENLVYITISGKKYHTLDCAHLSSPPIAITIEQAVEAGYTPCSRCHPDY